MNLTTTPELKQLGINACTAVIRDANISNKSARLENIKKEIIEKIKIFDISNNKILRGYTELYDKVGIKATPPAEQLIALIKKNGRLPNINTVVDCYNLVSADSFLSVGAHDTAHIKGNLTFKITDGWEKYTPLGETSQLKYLQENTPAWMMKKYYAGWI